MSSVSLSASYMESYCRYVNRPYSDFLRRMGMDFEVSRARGAVIEDRRGRKFVDCIGGYGNVNVGHNHPRVREAMVRALESARPFAWPFISEAHAQLVKKLSELAPGGLECTLLVNSGAEAVDSALKLVRLATGRTEVVCCLGAMHGFTMGAMSVSDPEMGRNFGPLLPGIRRVPYGDARAAADAITQKVGAVIVEPIQAESGGVVPPDGYLRELADACAASGALLVLDEIKSGMGKTGTMFACESEGVEPDLLLVGKSLGGGVMPVGAVVANRKWWGKLGLSFAMSASSASGNFFACVAGLATLEVIEHENLCANAARQGTRFQTALADLAARYPALLRGVTGRGLLLGLQTSGQKTAAEITRQCILQGVLLMPAFLDRSRMLIEPPLCITDAQTEEALRGLERACETISRAN